MSGSADDIANTNEAPEQFNITVDREDAFTERVHQPTSSVQERMAKYFEPGETKSTTRRLSDNPEATRLQVQDNFSGEDFDDQTEPPDNSVRERAREFVAKALGGESRGGNKTEPHN